MLALTRKLDQSVVLYTSNGEITVTLTENSHGCLVLAFDAPDAVKILRSELVDGIDGIEGGGLIDAAGP